MRWLAPWRLVGMVAPMALWALHFVLVYSLAGLACAEGWPEHRILGVRMLSWALLGSTALTFALIGWLGQRAWRARRALPPTDDARDAAECRRLARQRFASRVAVVLAIIAAIAVAFTSVPMFVLSRCL